MSLRLELVSNDVTGLKLKVGQVVWAGSKKDGEARAEAGTNGEHFWVNISLIEYWPSGTWATN